MPLLHLNHSQIGNIAAQIIKENDGHFEGVSNAVLKYMSVYTAWILNQTFNLYVFLFTEVILVWEPTFLQGLNYNWLNEIHIQILIQTIIFVSSCFTTWILCFYPLYNLHVVMRRESTKITKQVSTMIYLKTWELIFIIEFPCHIN